MAKVHFITETPSGKGVTTFCGRQGFETGFLNEYDTPIGDRFEAVPDEKLVTCKSCQRVHSLLRIKAKHG